MSATIERQTPWMPEPDLPQSPSARDGKELVECPPEAIFCEQHNYNASEISELAGIQLETVRAAAAEREISDVCTESHRGGKAWRGNRICAWIHRAGLKCFAPQRVALQWQADERARAAQAEVEKQRADAEEEARQRPIRLYREMAEQSPTVRDVLTVLAQMEEAGHRPGDVLRIIDGA